MKGELGVTQQLSSSAQSKAQSFSFRWQTTQEYFPFCPSGYFWTMKVNGEIRILIMSCYQKYT